MVRPGSFFSLSASFAVVGPASLRRVSSTWVVPVGELHLVPLASLVCCGTSLVGMPSRTPVPGSVTIFQPTFSCRRRAVSASTARSCGLSTPVCLPPLFFWYSLIAATMRSLTSPVIAPLYSPTQARSDCSASRSACAMAFAVSAGVCTPGGRTVVVVTGLGLVPLVCACSGPAIATTNKVAESTVLMTNPGIAAIADYAHLLGQQQPDPGSGEKLADAERQGARTLR